MLIDFKKINDSLIGKRIRLGSLMDIIVRSRRKKNRKKQKRGSRARAR